MLDSGLGAGHRRQRRGAPARRQRRAHAVVARLPHDGRSTTSSCATSTATSSKGTAARPPRRRSTSARCARHPESTRRCTATPSTARCSPSTRKPIPPVIEEVRGVPRRRRAGREVQDHRHRRPRRGGGASTWATAPRCSWPTTACSWSAATPTNALELADLVERTAEIVWGAEQLGEIVPLPDQIVEQFSSYYRMGRGAS